MRNNYSYKPNQRNKQAADVETLLRNSEIRKYTGYIQYPDLHEIRKV